MDEKEEIKRQKRLDDIFEYTTYAVCLIVFISIFLPSFQETNRFVVSLLCLLAFLSAFSSHGRLPPSHKGFISWDFETKTFVIGVLDYIFITLLMIFSGGIKSPYFFLYSLPLIVGSIVLPTIYLISEIVIIVLCYLLVRFLTFGFWPILDQNFYLAFFSVGLVAFLASRVGVEEVIARQKAQSLAKDLQEANIKLQELDKLKDEFLAIASHELRTPLAAIKGFISLVLSDDENPISPKAREYLMQAYKGNERLIKLINDLLSISRIESGRTEYMMMEFNPQEIVQDVVDELGQEAAKKNLYLRHERLPFKVYVKGDPEKLKEVIYNLVNNGIKFTDQGGVKVSYEVDDHRLFVRVSDTGEGIAKEDQELIFRKFQQIGPLLRRHPGGTGLGLYISKQYIEAMGGRIWLEESKVGKGSTFAFLLPCYFESDLSKAHQPAKMIEKARRSFFSKRN